MNSIINRSWLQLASWLLAGLVLALLPAAVLSGTPKSPPAPTGQTIYKQHCFSCHPGGANLVKPSKPVKDSKTLATFATFKAYLSAPLGHMPYYQHLVEDDAALKALYHYCRAFK